MATDWTIETVNGPLRVCLNDDRRACVLTPSNWGSYPELQYTVKGRRVGAMHVYLQLSDSGEWVGQDGTPGNGVSILRADRRPATAAQERAAMAIALETLAGVLAEHPAAPGLARIQSRRDRLRQHRSRLADVDATRAAILADIADASTCAAHGRADRHRCQEWAAVHGDASAEPAIVAPVPVPDGATCEQMADRWNAHGVPATRMIVYVGAPGAGIENPPAQSFCDAHADDIMARFPTTHADVTGAPQGRQDAPATI